MYSSEYPHTHLIAQEFKQRLLKGERDYHFDAYLTMLERVTCYLINGKEFRKRLAFARLCFYVKNSGLWRIPSAIHSINWRLDYLQKLVKRMGVVGKIN